MRRALQLVVLVLSLLPLAVGTLGLLLGVEFYIPVEAANPNLDSQFRFMSGWDVGLAIIVWWIMPRIESQTTLFRIVCFAKATGSRKPQGHGKPQGQVLNVNPDVHRASGSRPSRSPAPALSPGVHCGVVGSGSSNPKSLDRKSA